MRRVVSIDVRRDEIQGDIVFGGVLNHAVHPRGRRRVRAADAELGADALQRFRGSIVELVIGLLLGIAGPEEYVRLIPDFEVLPRDLVDALAFDQMLRELMDQVAPAGVILWRIDIVVVPKWMRAIRRCELLGHKAQFDKRPDAILEEDVVDLVDVGKIVNGSAQGIFVIDADFIVKIRVEADVPEPRERSADVPMFALCEDDEPV